MRTEQTKVNRVGDLNRDFGARIKALRAARGLSLRFVAAEAGISNPFLSQIETGKTLPSARVLESLADVYGLTMDRLWRGDISDKIGGES